MEIQQGDVLKVEKIKDPVFVASKNFFNQSGEIIGCPILRVQKAHFTFMLKWMKIKVISNVNK
mgnify:CR=1 FL=1